MKRGTSFVGKTPVLEPFVQRSDAQQYMSEQEISSIILSRFFSLPEMRFVPFCPMFMPFFVAKRRAFVMQNASFYITKAYLLQYERIQATLQYAARCDISCLFGHGVFLKSENLSVKIQTVKSILLLIYVNQNNA